MSEISTKYYESEYPRIDETEKNFWIEQLLSEKYAGKQAIGQLEARTPDGELEGFCCLGVYCDAKGVPKVVEKSRYYGPNHAIDNMPTVVYGNRESDNSNDWSWGTIPRGYEIPFADPETANKDRGCLGNFEPFYGDAIIFKMNVQGFESYFDTHGVALDYEDEFALTALNDSGEFTFAQIADIIRYFL